MSRPANTGSDQLAPFPPGVPSRVRIMVPLKVDCSPIPGAGEGMFALDGLKAGDLIFCIPRPPLCIVRVNSFH